MMKKGKAMDVENIMYSLGQGKVTSFKKVEGGRDSTVWRVNTEHGHSFALRGLPKERLRQYETESEILTLAFHHGIPTPKVHMVTSVDSYAIMLMDWINGCTLFQALANKPQNTEKIGYAFGKTQASIHCIQARDSKFGTWISPKTKDEEDIFEKIAQDTQVSHNGLIHLDFHPLNVLTDGEKITGVIDWVNASYGDYRFDIARTQSILTMVAAQGLFDSSTVKKFEEAWINGYERLGPNIQHLDLFNQWAEMKLKEEKVI